MTNTFSLCLVKDHFRSLFRIIVFFAGAAVFGEFDVSAQNAPIIITQPQSQAATPGATVTFSVAATGMTNLPIVSSGTMQLWLKADAGVETNQADLVSEWVDQSGHGNDAYQPTGTQQPLLEYPAAINFGPAIRFNGDQVSGQGSYLQGTNSVGIPDAYTSFLVYELDSGAPSEQVATFVGVPGTTGAGRGDFFSFDNPSFTTWGDDYYTNNPISTGIYRIWTDLYSTDLGMLRMFDDIPGNTAESDFATSGQSPPAAGYDVGGVNPNTTGGGRNFGGDIAEVIYYQGELTDSDRQAVLTYLEQKYYQIYQTDTFQWQVGTNDIVDATNYFLTLTDVATNESGNDYSVIVRNAGGSVQSAMATLFVGQPPSITSQPQSVAVLPGTNVTFSVTAGGTALTYQWLENNTDLVGQTNATLVLIDVSTNNVGQYSVVVSNGFGPLLGRPATLSIITSPLIVNQPQSQSVLAGRGVALSVAVSGGGLGGTLPAISSGTLQLWLRADYGVITNSEGQVSDWQDQSGNTNDATQASTNNQPLLVYPAGLGGAAALRFDGSADAASGDYLVGTGNVGVSNALTAFAMYSIFFAVPRWGDLVWLVGQPAGNTSKGCAVLNGDMDFTTWTDNYRSSFLVPSNTYRICTDRVNTNLSTVEMFDTTASSQTNFSFAMTGQQSPTAGYYIGGLNPTLPGLGNNGRCLNGDIAEVIIYQGSLSDADRLEVANYLEQKYYQINGLGLSFQWQWNGTNIPGATNATLYFAAVQATNAGTYRVIASNGAGLVTSSNAVLTVNVAPFISLEPQSQSNGVGNSVTFTAAASGDQPLSYQWQFGSINIAHATNASLTLSNIQSTNAGTYRLVVTNLYGSVTSSNAVLTVPTSTLMVVNSSATGSGSVDVPVQLVSAGNENTVNFSLIFTNSLLTYSGATLGSNASGAFMIANTSQAVNGEIGFEFELPGTNTFSLGTQQLVVVKFAVATVTNAVVTPITFGGEPTAEQVLNGQLAALPANYSSGTISIAATALEGDVSPRPNGNQILNINDWVQEGRFVAGLDIPGSSNEFIRADCAPRAFSGDGLITVADWVQVGRYAAGYDPLALIGSGPGIIGTISNTPSASRIISLSPLTQGQTNNSVGVQLAAQGTENAISFSVGFDPTSVAFVSASPGSDASGAEMYVNTNQAANGSVGLALALLPGTAFPAGTLQLVQLGFASVAYSNTVALEFADSPVARQVADTNAAVMPVSFQNGTLLIGGLVWPTLAINHAGSNVVLSWLASANTFGLQTASLLGTNWSSAAGTPVTNGGSLVVTSSVSTNAGFFRLQHH
jgi:hypothetical protein